MSLYHVNLYDNVNKPGLILLIHEMGGWGGQKSSYLYHIKHIEAVILTKGDSIKFFHLSDIKTDPH